MIRIMLSVLLILSVTAITALPERMFSSDVQARGQTIESGAYYKIVSRHSGKVLDVQRRSTSNGGSVQQWDWHGDTNQQWKIEDLGNGYYKIVARHSGKVLALPRRSTSNGERIQQWEWNGGSTQQWKIESVGNGYYRIVSRHSRKVLDLRRSSRSNGGNIQQWEWHGDNNQQWKIEKLVSIRDILALEAPANVTAEVDGSKVNITWEPVFTAPGYDIEINGRVVKSYLVPAISYTHEGDFNTEYTIRVRSTRLIQRSGWSKPIKVLTMLETPKNLKAEVSGRQIELSWGTVQGANSYKVYRNNTEIATTTTTAYIDNDIQIGESYTYTVRAYTQSGNPSNMTSPVTQRVRRTDLTQIGKNDYEVKYNKASFLKLDFIAPNTNLFHNYLYIINYNPDEFEALDLCAKTYAPELKTGVVAGTNIRIIRFVPGEIEYEFTNNQYNNDSFNSLRFKAKTSEGGNITYSYYK